MRSMPPASSRFIWYSGEVISQPSPAATAERWTSRPGARTHAGVSTSMKSRAANSSRSAAIMRLRAARLPRRA